jgi:hypothetical protein
VNSHALTADHRLLDQKYFLLPLSLCHNVRGLHEALKNKYPAVRDEEGCVRRGNVEICFLLNNCFQWKVIFSREKIGEGSFAKWKDEDQALVGEGV